MKKTLKIIGITLLVLLFLLMALPFVFQSQIKGMVKNFINQNVNAKVEFSDISLSLLRNFPNANVQVSDLNITTFEPFEDETFATAKDISFTMSIKELFKNADDDPIKVNSINIDEALLTLKTDALGNTNYDIVKESADPTDTTNQFAFDIKEYTIKNSALTYIDESSNTELYVTELNHKGNAKINSEVSELDTESEANVSLSIDSTMYLSHNHVKLDALIDMDLGIQKYTFKDNKGFINQLPLEFRGFVQMLEEGQDIDIAFENPGSSFKDFLAVMPETYSKNIENVKTTGDFKVSGIIKGKMTEETIPTLDISIKSNNASFKYPDLPKKVENIIIDAQIKNETGKTEDTYVAINALNFKIDQDVFKSSVTLKNITGNMLVDANVDGVLNLANLTKAYPIELEHELSGILRAKINTSFDMNALETNAYNRIKASGNANISNMVFSSDAMNQPLQLSKADMTFNPTSVTLNSFNAKTGQSDFSATGTINNLIGFMLSDNVNLNGNFNVNSNILALDDFMSADPSPNNTTTTTTSKTTTTTEALRIPEFLECTITAHANTVIYDNLNLRDVNGKLTIKDQQATLSGLTSKLFDGLLTVSGNVSTKTDTPSFNLKLSAANFDISQSFKNLELLQSLAPITKVLQGKLNTDINISGLLDRELSPQLNTVSGNAFAQLLTSKINEDQSPLLNKLDGALSFIDFDKLDLKNLAAHLEFANGKVSVKPFNLAYKDIGITVAGSHGFDKSLNYDVVFDVPAKYLGGDVNRLIGKINDNQVNTMSIPVIASIGGTYTNPQVTTDLTSGVANLTKQLIEIEKQKLIGKGKDKITELFMGIAGDKTNSQPTAPDLPNTPQIIDSTVTTSKTDPIKEGVKDILGGLLGGKKDKKKDSLN